MTFKKQMKALDAMLKACPRSERVAIATAYAVGFAHCAKKFTGSQDLAVSIAVDVGKDKFLSEMLKKFRKYLNEDELKMSTNEFVKLTS